MLRILFFLSRKGFAGSEQECGMICFILGEAHAIYRISCRWQDKLGRCCWGPSGSPDAWTREVDKEMEIEGLQEYFGCRIYKVPDGLKGMGKEKYLVSWRAWERRKSMITPLNFSLRNWVNFHRWERERSSPGTIAWTICPVEGLLGGYRLFFGRQLVWW